MPEFFDLSIAGLGSRVICPNRDLLGRLKGRYAAFTGEGRDLVCVVKVKAVPGKRQSSSILGLEPQFLGETVRLVGTGTHAEIDLPAQVATMSTANTHALNEVDYFLRVLYALLAFRAGGLLFHAAGIKYKNSALVFWGQSGSGKTTLARYAPPGSVLNDDLIVMLPDEPCWSAWATPFWHPEQVRPQRLSAPVASLFRLVQAPYVRLVELPGAMALAGVLANVPVINANPDWGGDLAARAQALLEKTPAYQLSFLPDGSYWRAIETLDDTCKRGNA